MDWKGLCVFAQKRESDVRISFEMTTSQEECLQRLQSRIDITYDGSKPEHQINAIKAALSNKEYEIITECAISNISEIPRMVPSLGDAFGTPKENIEKMFRQSHCDGF
ncbi:hypothetical protein HPP92_014886 [Vanilla planifolia]|uniref:Uncharacterized protein n=1 Tax=Vanilla planifolia TaxID=51239 RepID=A0A835QI61_VANPL|nr:hypothetical protein HPP92_014886 [Vanilla planifolia]